MEVRVYRKRVLRVAESNELCGGWKLVIENKRKLWWSWSANMSAAVDALVRADCRQLYRTCMRLLPAYAASNSVRQYYRLELIKDCQMNERQRDHIKEVYLFSSPFFLALWKLRDGDITRALTAVDNIYITNADFGPIWSLRWFATRYNTVST